MTLEQFAAANPSADPAETIRNYRNQQQLELLKSGEYDDLAPELDGVLQEYAATNGIEVNFNQRNDRKDLEYVSQYSQDPAAQAAARTYLAVDDPKIKDTYGDPVKYDEVLSSARAAVEQSINPIERNKARRAALDSGDTPFAVFQDPTTGEERLDVSPALKDLAGNDEALAAYFEANPDLDVSRIPEIRQKLRTPDGFTVPAFQIDRQHDWMGAFTKVLGEDKNIARKVTDLRAAADKGTPVNEALLDQIDTELGAYGMHGDTSPEAAAERKAYIKDFINMSAAPEVDEENLDNNIRTLSTGQKVLPMAVMLQRPLFDKVVASPSIPESQRTMLKENRDAQISAMAPEMFKTIAANRPMEFPRFMQERKDKGMSNAAILDEWMADPDNYSQARAFLGGVGESVLEGFGGLVMYPAAMLGNESARKALTDLQKSDMDRRNYAQMFGKNLGVGYDLTRLVAPVAADVSVSLLTGGAATAAVTSKNIVKSGIKTALKGAVEAGAYKAFTRGAATQSVDQIIDSAGKNLARKFVKTTTTASYLGTAFNRSAGSTYVQLYSQLSEEKNPDGSAKYTPEKAREIALNHGLIAGTMTAAITGGFSFLGAGGIESIYGNVSRKQLGRIFDKVKQDFDQLAPSVRAGLDMTNVDSFITSVAKKAVRPMLSEVGKGFKDEAMEEGLDQFAGYFNQQIATGDEINIADAFKQAGYAAMLGGIMGGTVVGINEAASGAPDVNTEALARRTALYDIAAKLDAASSPRTAEAIRRFAVEGFPATPKESVPAGAAPEGTEQAPSGPAVAGEAAAVEVAAAPAVEPESAVSQPEDVEYFNFVMGEEPAQATPTARPKEVLDAELQGIVQRFRARKGPPIVLDPIPLKHPDRIYLDKLPLKHPDRVLLDPIDVGDIALYGRGLTDEGGRILLSRIQMTRQTGPATKAETPAPLTPEQEEQAVASSMPGQKVRIGARRDVKQRVVRKSKPQPTPTNEQNQEAETPAPSVQVSPVPNGQTVTPSAVPAGSGAQVAATPEAQAPAAVARDSSKPEQMTPEEHQKARELLRVKAETSQNSYENARLKKYPKAADAQLRHMDMVSTKKKLADDARAQADAFPPTLAFAIEEAINSKSPFSVAAYESVGMSYIPTGYVKQGELYVYQPEQGLTEIPNIAEALYEHKGINATEEDAQLIADALNPELSASPELAMDEAVADGKDPWGAARRLISDIAPDVDVDMLSEQAILDMVGGHPTVQAKLKLDTMTQQSIRAVGRILQGSPIPTPAFTEANSPVTKEIIQYGGLEDITRFLQNVVAKAPKHQKNVAKLILEFGDMLGTVPITQVHLPNFPFSGAYIPETGQILINTAVPGPRGAVDTVLHELLHAATTHSIANPTPAQQKVLVRLERIRQSVKKRAEKNGMKHLAYGLSSLDEMLTHWFTSPTFQSDVSALTPKGERNWVQVIVEAIKDLLNGKVRTQQDKVSQEIMSDLIAFTRDAAYERYGPHAKTTDGRVLLLPAYHGTPHKVDRFSMSKIGTGEGAQAYGWGLYFAQDRGVADFYAKTLSGDVWKLRYKDGSGFFGAPYLNKEDAEKDFQDLFGSKGRTDIEVVKVKEDTEKYVYQVELLVDDDQLLDWDLPLSEQSELVKTFFRDSGMNAGSINESGRLLYERTVGRSYQNRYGERLDPYDNALAAMGDQGQAASKMLADAGIKGIRFLDGNSRSKGEGKYNYVIFDENDIQITAENGVPVTAAQATAPEPGPYGPTPRMDALMQLPEGDVRNTARFIELTRGVTPENVEQWRAENPEAYEELRRMREEVLRDAGWDVGPVYHGTNADFTVFDLSKSSAGAVWGPAIYASMDGGSWNPASLSTGKTIEGMVAGDVIDFSNVSKSDLDRLSQLVGREVEAIPFISLEKRFGSVAEGLKAAGYSAAIHKGPGSTGRHIAVFSPEALKSTEPLNFDSENQLILPHRWADAGSPDIRFQLPEGDMDTEYLAAVERGDMETAQRMVDEARRSSGSLLFSAKGQFVLQDRNVGRIEVYGNTKPLDMSKTWEDVTTLGDMLRDLGEIRGKNSQLQVTGLDNAKNAALISPRVMIHDGYSLDYADLVDQVGEAKRLGYSSIVEIQSTNAIKDVEYETRNDGYYVDKRTDELLDPKMSYDYENRRLRTADETREVYSDLIRRTNLKHPSVRIITWGDTSTDPVTYDDQGNVIPLSQRFNTGSPDIRFQIPEAPHSPDLVRAIAAGFTPDDVDLDINFDALIEGTKGLNPVNREHLIAATVNRALSLKAGFDALGDDVTTDERERLTRMHEMIMSGYTLDSDIGFYRSNPTAMQKLVRFLTAAVKAAYARLKLRFDNRTAVFIDRMTRELSRAKEGYRTRSTRKRFDPADPDGNAQYGPRFLFAGEQAEMPQFRRDSLETARAMAASGKSTEEIRAVTGWFPGKYDGKMRWEIPDVGAKLTTEIKVPVSPPKVARGDVKGGVFTPSDSGSLYLTMADDGTPDIMNGGRTPEEAIERWYEAYAPEKAKTVGGLNDGKLSDVLDHPELFKAYPALRDVNVVFRIIDSGGKYSDTDNQITLNEGLRDKKTSLSILLHEVQHAVQSIEGFAEGSNVRMFGSSSLGKRFSNDIFNKLTDLNEFLSDRNLPIMDADFMEDEDPQGRIEELGMDSSQAIGYDNTEDQVLLDYLMDSLSEAIRKGSLSPTQKYNRTAGEIEARDVQARATLTPEQLAATAPYSSENIAPEDAIVLMDGGASAMMQLPNGSAEQYLGVVREEDVDVDVEAILYGISDAAYNNKPTDESSIRSYLQNLIDSNYMEGDEEPLIPESNKDPAFWEPGPAKAELIERVLNNQRAVVALTKHSQAQKANDNVEQAYELAANAVRSAMLVPRVTPDIRFQLPEPGTEYTAWTEVDVGNKLFDSDPNQQPRGYFGRMFKQSYDLRDATSAALKSRDALQKAAQNVIDVLRDKYQRALKEGADPDLLRVAIGSNKPMLTLEDELAIEAEFNIRNEAASNIAAPRIQQAQKDRAAARRRATTDEERDAVEEDYALAVQNAKALQNKAFSEVAEWERTEMRDRALANAERLREQSSIAMEKLQEQSPIGYEWAFEMRKTLDEIITKNAKEYANDRPELAWVMDNSQGVYLVRTFNFHRDPTMADKLLHSTDPAFVELQEVGINFFGKHLADLKVEELRENPAYADYDELSLRAQALTEVREEAKKLFEDYVMGQEGASAPAGSGLHDIRTEFQRFMRKKDLPDEILEILGEIDDPLFNSMRTFSSVTGILFNQRMLKAVRKDGLKSGWLIDEATKTADKKYSTWVPFVAANEKSESYAPLAGLYAAPKDVEALKAALNVGGRMSLDTAGKTYAAANRALIGAAGLSMGVMTLGSVGYFTRNMVGGVLLALSQGTNPASKLGWESMKTAYTASFGKNTDADVQELIARRVLGDGVNITYLKEFLQKYREDPINILQWAENKGFKLNEQALDKLRTAGGGWTKMTDFLSKAAEFTETFQNPLIYFSEFDALMESGLYEGNEEGAKQEAARRTKMVTPGKSENPQAVTQFSKNPLSALVAPFIRFKAEMMRTTWNTYALAIQDINSGNATMRAHGINRMQSAIVVHGAITIGLPLLMQYVLGISDEEDEAIRKGMPAYSRNSTFIYIKDKETGELTTWDLSFANPFSFVFDPFTQVIKAGGREDYSEIPAIATRFVTSDLMGEQIVAGKALDVSRNIDESTGLPIYMDVDNMVERFTKSAMHILEGSYTPQVLRKSAQAIQATYRPDTDEEPFFYTPLGILVGHVAPVRPRSHKPEDLAYRAFRNIQKSNAELWQITGPMSSPAPMDPEDVTGIYEKRKRAGLKVWQEMYRTGKAFQEMGLTQHQVARQATDAGLSKKRVGLALNGFMERPVIAADKAKDIREIDERRLDVYREAVRKTPQFIRLD